MREFEKRFSLTFRRDNEYDSLDVQDAHRPKAAGFSIAVGRAA